jgi:hypothetical protein
MYVGHVRANVVHENIHAECMLHVNMYVYVACMCVCMYVCMYVCMHVYMYVCMYLCVYVWMYMHNGFVHTPTRTSVYPCMESRLTHLLDYSTHTYTIVRPHVHTY